MAAAAAEAASSHQPLPPPLGALCAGVSVEGPARVNMYVRVCVYIHYIYVRERVRIFVCVSDCESRCGCV